MEKEIPTPPFDEIYRKRSILVLFFFFSHLVRNVKIPGRMDTIIRNSTRTIGDTSRGSVQVLRIFRQRGKGRGQMPRCATRFLNTKRESRV